MNPSDDFASWCCVFDATAVPGSDYQYLIPGFIELINDYISDGHLSGILEQHTQTFIVEFLPQIVRKILNFRAVSVDEIDIICSSIVAVSNLAAHHFCTDKLDEYEAISFIFDCSNLFYSSNTTYAPLNKIIEQLKQDGWFIKMNERCLRDDVTVNHFYFYYKIFENILSPFTNEDALVSLTLNHFVEFIDKVEPENTKLNYSIIYSLGIAPYALNVDNFFEKILQYAEKCIYSRKVNIQMHGATILSICEDSTGSATIQYQKWKANTKLIEFLSTEDLHSELLKALESVYVSLLTPDSLYNLWNASLHAHSSKKPLMMKIVSKGINELPTEEAEKFIVEASKDISPDTIDFLIQTMFNTANSNSELSLFVFQLMLGLECDSFSQEVCKMIDYSIPELYKTKLFKVGIECIEGPHQSDIAQIFSRILDVSYCLDKILPHDFIDHIISLVHDHKINKNHFIPVILAYCKKIHIIDESMLTKFEQFGFEDNIWEFLEGMISNMSTCISSECYEKLGQILLVQDKIHASHSLAKLCIQYVLIYALKNSQLFSKNDKNISITLPKEFYLTKFPLKYLELISDIYFYCVDENVSQLAQKKLLQILDSSQDKKGCVKYADEKLSLCETDEQKLRGVLLIKRFLSMNNIHRPEDFDIQPHKKVHRYGEKILRVYDEKTKKTFQINYDPRDKSRDIIERVCCILERNTSITLVDKSNKYNLNYTTMENVPDRELFNVVENFMVSPFVPQFPLLYFVDEDLSQKIYDILVDAESKELTESCIELLDLLPDCSLIISIFSDEEATEELLAHIDNESLFNYIIEILMNNMSVNEEYYTQLAKSIYHILIDKLKSPKIATNIINLFSHHFDPKFSENIEILAPIIINNYSMSENMDNCFFLMYKIDQIKPTELNDVFLHDNHEKIIDLLGKCNLTNWGSISRLLSLFDKKEVFDLCLEEVKKENENLKFFITMMNMNLYFVSNEINTNELKELLFSLLIKNKDNKNSLSEICKILTDLIKNCETNDDNYKEISESILDVALTKDDPSIQSSLFNLLKVIGFDKIFLNEYIKEVKLDKFSMNPDDRRLQNQPGLKNLSATCYMNSVLQQLFSVKTFLNDFENTCEGLKPGIPELQMLFARMNYSKEKYVDTTEFCETWLWGKTKINPREQQDANEFYQILLDQMPKDINKYFRGSIRNIIKGEKEDYESYNNEDFYSIELEIKNTNKIENSFNLFGVAERFESHFAEKLNKKIDILKSAKIETAPPIMVFHLKRFEYNLQTFNRIKVNSNFQFSDEIDISEMMLDNSNPCKYNLTGIVMHHGTAQGGHYTSYVRVTSNKWMSFDDTLVTTIDDQVLKEKAFGKSDDFEKFESFNDDDLDDTGTSAYLLFYTKDGENTKCEVKYSDEKVTQIEKENDEFLRVQSLLSYSFLDFVCDTFDNPVPYFINIYCRSNLNSYNTKMTNCLYNFIETNENSKEILEDLFLNNFDKVFDIYKSCSLPLILGTMLNFTRKTIEFMGPDISIKIVNNFIDNFPSLTTIWRQIPDVCAVIEHFVTKYPKFSNDYGLADHIIEMIKLIYSTQRNQIYLQNVNVSNLLSSLHLLENFDCKILVEYANYLFMSSENTQSAGKLFSKLCREGKIEMSQFLHYLLTSSNQKDIEDGYSLMAEMATESEQVFYQICETAISNRILSDVTLHILLKLRSGKSEVKRFFINNPNCLYNLLTYLEDDVRMFAEKILIDMFHSIPITPIMEQCFIPTIYNSIFHGDNNHNEHHPRSNTALSNMRKIFSVLEQKIEYLRTEPRHFYSSYQGNGIKFYATNLIDAYSYLLIPLDMNNQEKFNYLYEVSEILSNLKIPNDKNLIKLYDLLLKCFSPRIEQSKRLDIIFNKVVFSNSYSKISPLIDLRYELGFYNARDNQEQLNYLLCSDFFFRIIFSQKSDDCSTYLVEILDLIMSMNQSHAKNLFLSKLFELVSDSSLQFLIHALSYCFRYSSLCLSEYAVSKFAFQFLNFMKKFGEVVFPKNNRLDYIRDGCDGLCCDQRWIGKFQINIIPLIELLIISRKNSVQSLTNLILLIMPLDKNLSKSMHLRNFDYDVCKSDVNRSLFISVYMEFCFIKEIQCDLSSFLPSIEDLSMSVGYLLSKAFPMTNNMWQQQILDFILDKYNPGSSYDILVQKLVLIHTKVPENVSKEWKEFISQEKIPEKIDYEYFDADLNEMKRASIYSSSSEYYSDESEDYKHVPDKVREFHNYLSSSSSDEEILNYDNISKEIIKAGEENESEMVNDAFIGGLDEKQKVFEYICQTRNINSAFVMKEMFRKLMSDHKDYNQQSNDFMNLLNSTYDKIQSNAKIDISSEWNRFKKSQILDDLD